MAAWIPAAVVAATKVVKGEQERRQGNYMAALDEQNARTSLQQGAAEEESIRRRNALQMGDVRASAVQSGFDANSGSLATLQTKTSGELELDALTTRYRAGLEAIGHNIDAGVKRQNARNARTSGYLDAFATLAGDYGVRKYGSQATKIRAG